MTSPRVLLAALLILVCLLAAGCGSSDDGGDKDGSGSAARAKETEREAAHMQQERRMQRSAFVETPAMRQCIVSAGFRKVAARPAGATVAWRHIASSSIVAVAVDDPARDSLTKALKGARETDAPGQDGDEDEHTGEHHIVVTGDDPALDLAVACVRAEPAPVA